MKIAIPTRGSQIDDHFGHCQAYTVFTVDVNNKIEKSEIVPSPQGCGCKSNIASIFKDMGVTIMLAGNMGNGALNILNNHGIKVYRGCSGEVSQITESYLNGKIDDSGTGCNHHDEGHQCNH